MCGGGGGNIIDVVTDPVTIVSAVAAGFLAPGAGFSISAALLAGGSIAATALLAPSPEVPDLTIGADRVTQGRNVSIRQAIAPWRVTYGTVRVGGIFVNLNTSNSNQYLHVTIVMACHEINAFTKLHLDDDVLTIGSSPFTSSGNDSNGVARYEVTSGTFYDSNSKIRAKFHTGTSTQLADADQVSELGEWTTNHRLRGRAYIYVRCEHDDEIFRNGMPSMSVVIQGKKVYDPRNTNTAFSNNPALCIRDFLTDTSFGLKIAATEINDANTVGGFAYAANRCEDTINSANRYSCDGTFDLSQSPKQILDQMLSSCAGKLIYQNGKFNIYVGFYTAPTITLTQEDFIEPIQLVTKLGRKDIFNKVSGTFYDAANNFVADEFTPIVSSQYKTEDNNEEITADVEFTFTTSETKCRELALIELLKARQQIALSCSVSLKQGLQIQCGDFVKVTLTRLGFTNKVFEVQEWSMNSSNTEGEPILACTMLLREFDTTVYDNSVLSDIAASKEQATDPNANTNLSIATSVAAPTNLTLTQQSSPNTDAVEVAWEFDGVMSQFQIEYKLSSAGSYTEQVVPGFNRRFTIRGLTTGQTYNFRIKSVSTADSSSSFATANITL
jgi:hypothetical protein